MRKIRYIVLLLAVLFTQPSCEEMLDVTPEGEFAPDNVLTSEAGLKALLFSAYANFQQQIENKNIVNITEVTTDMAYNTGGAENLQLSQFINFTWDPSVQMLEVLWAPYYRAVRDANLVIENVNNIDASDAVKKQYTAEARFLRGYVYGYLYNWFGPVPLRTSSDQSAHLPRATDEEMKAFIEKELSESVSDLPDPGEEEAFGRATKGAALGVLAKFYLNTKQWAKAAETAKRVMDLNYYELYPVFKDMFKVENEGNKEMILVVPALNEAGHGNWWAAGAQPPGFRYSTQVPEYVWKPGIANFATQYRLRDAFVNTFDPADKRFELVIRTYVNAANATVNLRTTPDNTRSLKFFDVNAVGNHHGNDIPIIRYADILLTRAEALNEINGPTQEALDLINAVRNRSNLGDLTLADATSKEVLRDIILRERGWEFVSEGKRREDLIRHGKFLSLARARGVANVQEHHLVFPIPLDEVTSNTALEHTDGY